MVFPLNLARGFALTALLAAPACALAATPPAPNVARLDIELSPTYGSDGAANGVAVRYAYHPVAGNTTPLVLDLDTLEPSLERATDVVSDLVVSDDRGPLQLADAVKQKKANGSTYQEWKASRATEGTVKVSYRMPVARSITAKRGPVYDLQAAGGGIAGGYIGFLVLPDTAGGSFATHVAWKLKPGAMAVSSYGEGDYQGTYTPETLLGTLFEAGPVNTYRMPGQANDGGVSVYALGLPKDQLKGTGDWTARAHAAEIKAFQLHDKPYRFMIRSYEGGANPSGRAAENSFMLYVPPGADPNTTMLHHTVAHEMVHSLAATMDKDQEAGDWYTEGLADYIAMIVPNAAGLYTPQEYAELVGSESAGYYTNAKRAIPNSEIPSTMWTGRNAWMIPYNRGSMYLADLDAKLKAHGSKSTVLSLANEMSRRIDGGAPSEGQTWVKVLSDGVGDWAVADWNAMMQGKVIYPAAGAFGQCMHATKQDVRIFDLGFSKPLRLTAGLPIGGLVKNSPAEAAGLRDGDVLQKSVDINVIATSLDKPIVLDVLRDGKPRTITYSPSGGTQPGVAWTSSCVK